VKYSIDTSAILDGWNRYYPPDVVPGLWNNIEEMIGNGDLIASEEVLRELSKKDDEAYRWAKGQDGLWVPTDSTVQIEVKNILKSHQRLIDTRKNRSGADPFVIAVAKVFECKLITGERPNYNPSRPHIPDVCNAMGIDWMDLLQLCREQKWTFR